MNETMLRQARTVVDRAGLAGRLTDLIVPRRPDGTVELRGRNRALSVRTLLLACACAAIDGRPLHVTRLTELIRSWTRPERQLLGIDPAEAGRLPTVTHKQVSDLFNAVLHRIDPSPHFAAPHLTGTTQSERDAELAERRRLLQDVLDRIVEGSLDRPGTGSYIADWTYLPSWAGKRRSGRPSPDPDAGWISIKGHGYNPKWYLFGYRVHSIVRTRTVDGRRVPNLCERLVLTHAAAAPQQPIVDIVERDNPLTDDGLPSADRLIRELIEDRGYSNAVAERWAVPLRRHGVGLVFDLHPDQRGRHGTAQGAACVNGSFYCPATPDTLLDLERPGDFATVAERTTEFVQFQRLDRHRCVPHTRPDPATGDQRFTCPARAGNIRCPLVPDSMTGQMTRPTAYPNRTLTEHPPPICAQQTVTISGDAQAALRQSCQWGSEPWFDTYTRRRSHVESFFSAIRDPGSQHMARGRIKTMGVAKNSFFVAWWTAAVNLRLIAAYEDVERHRLRDPNRLISRRPPRANRAVPFADLHKPKRRRSREPDGIPLDTGRDLITTD